MSIAVTFEKVVGEGKALGYVAGKPCFAAGPLPGEVAQVEVVRDKSKFLEARAVEITTASVQRNLPAEDHFLLCSPWQGVAYEYQLELKRGLVEAALGRPGLELAVTDMIGAPKQLGYRNKLEFSVAKDAGGDLGLAFHSRGSYEDLRRLPDGCRLGPAAMNAAALGLVQRAGALKLGGYMETLTVRQSVATGKVLGVVALHQTPPKRDYAGLVGDDLAGVVVTRLRGRHEHELLWHAGEPEVVERLAGLDIAYPYDGFFQTNPPVFGEALERILAAVPEGGKLVDLYGGVGTIGLAAARKAATVVGVEAHTGSAEWATANADRNGLRNYTSLCAPAQHLEPRVLQGVDCVVVDPPRAGLEGRLVDALLAAAPARIIYLSCNPVTQARDLLLLGETYQSQAAMGFDFYPGTLHVESLVVLDRR